MIQFTSMRISKELGFFTIMCMLLALLSDRIDAQFENLPVRPLCASQFALANRACKNLPYYTRVTPEAPPTPDEPPYPYVEPPPEEAPPAPEDPEGHRHRRRHRHRRSPPLPPPEHHHHHRRRRHRPQHEPSRSEADCCRWLQQVDTECVCDVLVRMPIFMSKPLHAYVVTVPEVCQVTFSCSSRIRIK